MAENNMTLTDFLTDIANAIRGRLGISDKIVAAEFPIMLTRIADNSVFCSILNKTIETIPQNYLVGVTSIGDYVFSDCTNMTSITLPNSITSIGYGAFMRCSSLTSITIPNSVTSIGEDAFFGCRGLTNITIPNSVTSIGDFAFGNCTSLTTINVPWSEGAVAGAPWGAPNAIVNYNYTGE